MSKAVFEFRPHGVSDEFAERSGIPFDYITADYAQELIIKRKFDGHKYAYGHALLVCGSRGMAGAAILATGGALRSGCGVVTAHIPADERFALTANYPSALVSLDPESSFSQLPKELERFGAVGVGCGLGQSPATCEALKIIISECRQRSISMVLDADALNIIANQSDIYDVIGEDSIFTPHDGELKRLIGSWQNEEEKIEKVIEFTKKHRIILISKGPNSMVCVRGERLAFNSTGNSGMAKGGSGDVLTGFITGLIARGYSPENAAKLGVYIHGLAGDKARDYYGAEGMNSGDMIDFLAEAILEIQ